MEEESKEKSLLHPLKLFETSVVVSFLTTGDKILLMSLLSKKWNAFIYHPYAWPRSIKQISRDIPVYYRFLSRLGSLEGFTLHLPWQHSLGLKQFRKLQTASEIFLS